MSDDLERAFRWMREIARELALPGVAEGTFMRRPSLTMRGKSIIGSKDGLHLVIHCPLEEEEMLLEACPGTYFETDHYKGYPALFARPGMLTKPELQSRIEAAWAMHATKAMLRQRAEG